MLNISSPLARDGQAALDNARRIAEQHKQPSVDSLMILLALLQLPNSQVWAVLKSLNVKVENLAARVSATIMLEAQRPATGPEEKRNGIHLSAESESILSESAVEMRDQGLGAIDGCILLLGMLRSPDSGAGQMLAQYGVTVEQGRARVKIIKETPAPKKHIFALPKLLARGMRDGISPVFISLVLFTVVMAGFMWFGIGSNPRVFMISFIIGGWIISVALHEFGHAITAFWGGDESVEHKGYLTLNPLKYTHPILSIVIPVVMLLLGGIGFPGGAVYINVHALRKKNYRSLVSAAGPLANLLLIILLALPFGAIPFWYFFSRVSFEFMTGVAFLAFLQITSLFINLLPIPGLDGYGILEPFLPHEVTEFFSFLRPFSFLILYLLLFVDSPISDFFWLNIWSATELISPNLAYFANEGVKIFLNR